MSTHIRKPRIMFVTLSILSVFIGPADAIGPQEPVLTASVSATPASMSIAPIATIEPAADAAESRQAAGASLPEPAPSAAPENDAVDNPANSPDVAQSPSVLPERAAFDGIAADLFAGHTWYTPPPARAVIERQAPPTPRAPAAPPLPFSYMGSFEQDGAGTLYYLVEGDRVHDVRVGDVINGKYRVDGVTNGSLMFTYLPLATSQGLRLGEQK